MRKYSPERYIVHPVRVMKMCAEYNDSLPVLAAALLHDVLEDTPVTRNELHAYLLTEMSRADADKTIDLVVELTDVYVKKDYPKMNRRTRKGKEQDRMAVTSAEAQTIKYADIIDNCKEITKEDPDFANVFLRECKALLKRMDKGDKELYEKALNTVNSAMRK
jgi:guanosine-3',5'-bis(diphosphate) 3'-pyrophosphohydrolase